MSGLSAPQDKNVWIHYQAALKAARLLNKAGFDAYLIGGAVRDILIGKLPKDFDLVTNAKPEQILKLSGVKQAKYKDPAQAFGISRLKVELSLRGQSYVSEVEVATYRRDIEAHLGRLQTKVEFTDLAEDIQRRDYTINALALDLANDYLVDLTGGLDDLKAKVVRFIGQPSERIKEDPLRVLRGIRLKVQLGFDFDSDTKAGLEAATKAGAVKQIAIERTRDELTSMLVHGSRRQAVEELDRFGIIKQLLPEVSQTKGVPQPPEFHSEGDVWTHTLLAIGYLKGEVSSRLAWATLLHDIGKPPTFQTKTQTGDRIRFSEHYRVGAEMASKLLSQLKLSKKFISDITWMIENHIGIDNLPKMRPTRAEHFMSHPAFADLMELHKADARASWHLRPDGKLDLPHPQFRELHRLWDDYLSKQHTHPPSLKDIGVDGSWLKAEFKLTDGPQLGKLLHQLQEAYLDNKISNQAEAKKMAAHLLE